MSFWTRPFSVTYWIRGLYGRIVWPEYPAGYSLFFEIPYDVDAFIFDDKNIFIIFAQYFAQKDGFAFGNDREHRHNQSY